MPNHKAVLKYLAFPLFLTIMIISSCGHDKVAGTTNTENAREPVVLGKIIHPSGNSGGTEVFLVPEKYNPVFDDPLPDSAMTITGEDGDYLLPGPDSGIYNIKAHHPASELKLLRLDIRVEPDVDTTLVPTDTLREIIPITVSIPLNQDRHNGYIFLEGTDVSVSLDTIPDSINQVVISSIPAGIVPAIYYAQTNTDTTLPSLVLIAPETTITAGDTNIIGDQEADTLFKEDNPHIIDREWQLARPLVIMPGARILFKTYEGKIGVRSTLDSVEAMTTRIIAIGTEQDSIYFYHDEPQKAGIPPGRIYLYGGHNRFEWCVFEGIGSMNADAGEFAKMQFENCRFSDFRSSHSPLEFSADNDEGVDVLIFRDCHVQAVCNLGGFRATTIKWPLSIIGNIFDSTFYFGVEAGASYNPSGLVISNNFNSEAVFRGETNSFSGLTLENNIIKSIVFEGDSAVNLYHNIIESYSGTPPDSLLFASDTLNANGDSTDAYFNLLGNAEVIDSLTGELAPTSKAIGAASDGGNIGKWQGN